MATSWVIRERATKRVVCETWSPATIRTLPEGYEAVPILGYLAEINRAARAHLTDTPAKEPVEA